MHCIVILTSAVQKRRKYIHVSICKSATYALSLPISIQEAFIIQLVYMQLILMQIPQFPKYQYFRIASLYVLAYNVLASCGMTRPGIMWLMVPTIPPN